jgi:hypothetical protein
MKTRPTLFLPAFFAAALATAGACGGNHLLVGDDPQGGSAGANPGGTAGSGPTTGRDSGVSGTAGAGHLDAGGTVVDGSATTSQPLPISGQAAITLIAQVLWHAPPDGAVLTQAEQGAFTTINDLYPAIDTMLADPRAAVGVGAFYRQWLELDAIGTTAKDAQTFPAYTPQLQADMANETETFAVNVTLAMNGSYKTLMTAPFSFINEDLAGIYGVSGVSGGALRQVALDPTARAGLLTQPGLQALGSLATRNSPSHRGSYISSRLTCQDVPAFHTDVPALVLTPGVSVRTALLVQSSSSGAECAACHQQIDQWGLAFETFDAIGRSQTMENGAAIDVSNLILPDGTRFSGPIGAADALADDTQAQRCMAQQWLAYLKGTAFGQPLTSADEAIIDQLDATFVAADLNIQALLAAGLTSPAFLSHEIGGI